MEQRSHEPTEAPKQQVRIVDQDEVIRWLRSEFEYKWCIQEYRRKYGIDTSPSFWGMARRRFGIPLPPVDNSVLLPWDIAEEEQWQEPCLMLRAELRHRRGYVLANPSLLDEWKTQLAVDDLVVHYDTDADPELGTRWRLVPRRPGIDRDLIREPDDRVALAH